jgi:NADH-quinone oxidoreductase subunit J
VETVIYTCLGLLLIFGISAIMFHSMIKSAIALAAASAVLGIIMYKLGAVWAAIFEISVCSGLVTVIFISAISLSNTDKEDLPKLYEDKKRMAFLPLVLIVSGVLLIVVAISSISSLPVVTPAAEVSDNFREILWNHRQADIWGQIIVLITGALAVAVLFKEGELL